MRKVIYIILVFLILVFLVSGCSASRKIAGTSGSAWNTGKFTIDDLLSRNITAVNFNIPKCEISIKTEDLSEKFVAGIKYEVPGKYLITLRTSLGIELARIFITSDTILANDRINRNLYYGKPSVLAYKYGIPFEMIPVILGDLVIENEYQGKVLECSAEKSELDGTIRGRKISYDVDCRKKKISGSVVEGSGVRDNAYVRYSDFTGTDDIVVPARIEISNGGASTITLQIDKIEKWDGKIEFIPGSRYGRIELK